MNRQKTTSCFLIIVLASFVLAQQPKLSLQLMVPQNVSAASVENNLANLSSPQRGTELFPARGGEVDWGLALSGGGIRAASFSIGVLKALNENALADKKSLLDEIDVISSVSGGGFASYWLLNHFERNGSAKFGEGALDDKVFLKNVCELQRTSDFFTLKHMLHSLLLSKSKVFSKWENAIQRSFGKRAQGTSGSSALPNESLVKADSKINFFAASVEKGDVPYYIFNTTLKSKELNRFATVIELTPTHRGNPVLGFSRWGEGEEVPRLSEAVTMSAAAVEGKLSSPIPNYAPHIWSPEELVVSDGGHSENLGALPLIRRGLENIIIVDAEHDPHYIFEGYQILKGILRCMNVEITVPDIDDFLKANGKEFRPNDKKKSCGSSLKFASRNKTNRKAWYAGPEVSAGTAKSIATEGPPAIDSKIYYIKMARPASIVLSDPESDDGLKRGRQLAAERDKAIGLEEGLSGSAGGNLDCDKATGMRMHPDMYRYLVNHYIHLEGTKFQPQKTWLPAFAVSYFPQTTTARQDFYPKQLEAFVGLGYLQASKLEPILKTAVRRESGLVKGAKVGSPTISRAAKTVRHFSR